MDKISNIKVALMKMRDGHYSFSCNGDAQLLTIAFFLADDCPEFLIEKRIEWALDPHGDEIDFNATSLCKVGIHIELSSLIDERNKACVYFSPKDFVHMLEAWKKLIIARPPTIIISLAKGKVTLEALDSTTEPLHPLN